MNTEILLRYFDRISDAPDAVPRLRQFVLDLAVRGKLVEQDSNDEPAPALLRRIHVEKARLESAERIVPAKSNSTLPSHRLSFELRPGWEAAKLGDILLELQTGPFGSSLHQSDYRKGGVPVINPASIQNGQIVPIETMAVGPETLERLATFKLRAADIVLARRGEMGRCAAVTEREAGWLCGTGCLVLRLPSNVCPQFFTMLIGSPLVRGYLGGSAVGATMQNLNQSILLNLVVGVPPEAEQHRIVAKVDELMVLCDRLEEAQSDREARRDLLAAASLHHLDNGANGEQLREHARFFINHLPRLTARAKQTKQIRHTLFNLALRGKLLPQSCGDEPVSETLRRVRAERTLAEEAGRMKPLPTLPATNGDNAPFPLPLNWQWIRLGQLVLNADAGWSPRTENFPRSGDNWGVLKVSAVSWEQFLAEENKQLLPDVVAPTAAQVHKGDFLISRANTSELVAKSVIVEQEPYKLILSDKIVRLQLTAECNRRFVSMVNNHAVYARRYYAEEASGTSLSMKNVSRDVIYALPIPLPPLAEQERIVAKVDELIAVCDQLEVLLTTVQAESGRLLEAVLHKALATLTAHGAPSIGVTLDRRRTEPHVRLPNLAGPQIS